MVFPDLVILHLTCTEQKRSQEIYQFCIVINISNTLLGIPLQLCLSSIKFCWVFTMLFINLLRCFAPLIILPLETAMKQLCWCCQVWKRHQHRNTKILATPGLFLDLLTAEAGWTHIVLSEYVQFIALLQASAMNPNEISQQPIPHDFNIGFSVRWSIYFLSLYCFFPIKINLFSSLVDWMANSSHKSDNYIV